MPELADRVYETTTTTGTGALSLGGAVTGYQTFAAGVGDGSSCAYVISDGTDWEVGVGTLTAGSPDTLSRDTVKASSNDGAAVDWGSGEKDVFNDLLAYRMLELTAHIASEANPHNTDYSQTGAAPAAEGVTNGDSHDHNGGDGAQIDHGHLSGVGASDHHTRYTDTEAVSAVNAETSLSVNITGDADTVDGYDAGSAATLTKDLDDDDTDYPQLANPDSDSHAPTSGSVTVLVKDRLRASVESATGGQCTVLYDDQDLPSYMRIIPAMTADTLMAGMPSTLHPAFLKNSTNIPELFIGMFQSYVIGGRAYSLPYKNPTVNVDFDEARGYCTAKGTGWHLMTNWEWAAVALWCMENGIEPRGNTDHGRAHDATYETGTRQDGDTYIPGDSDGVGNILCGTGPYSWRHDQTPAGISDLVGNVWEWVDGFKLDGGRIYMPADNEYDLAESSWPAMDQWFSDESGTLTLKNSAGTSTEDALNVVWGSVAKEAGYTESDLLNMALISPNGVIPQGRLYARTADERVPFRGGSRSNAGSAGLAALYLSSARSNSSSYIGFRISYSNV